MNPPLWYANLELTHSRRQARRRLNVPIPFRHPPQRGDCLRRVFEAPFKETVNLSIDTRAHGFCRVLQPNISQFIGESGPKLKCYHNHQNLLKPTEIYQKVQNLSKCTFKGTPKYLSLLLCP